MTTKIERSACVETFTKEQVESWAAGKNRNRKPAQIKMIAESHLNGTYDDNGEAVVFDWNGKLIDGQNRRAGFLKACESDPKLTWTTTVSYGVNPKHFRSIDQNTPRNANDVYTVMGEAHARELAVAGRFIWSRLYKGTTAATGKFSGATAVKVLKDHEGLEESVKLIMTVEGDETGDYESLSNIITLGLLAGLHYLFASVDEDKADQFIHFLAGAGELDKDHPARRLRNVLSKNRGASKKYNRNGIVALCIKAWKAFVEGESLTRLEAKDREVVYVGGLDQEPEEVEEDEPDHPPVDKATQPVERKKVKKAPKEEVAPPEGHKKFAKKWTPGDQGWCDFGDGEIEFVEVLGLSDDQKVVFVRIYGDATEKEWEVEEKDLSVKKPAA